MPLDAEPRPKLRLGRKLMGIDPSTGTRAFATVIVGEATPEEPGKKKTKEASVSTEKKMSHELTHVGHVEEAMAEAERRSDELAEKLEQQKKKDEDI